MNPELVQALMGTGSPEEMDQMRRYQAMLKQYPSFAPQPPGLTGGDLADAVRGAPMPGMPPQNANMGQPGPMPPQGGPPPQDPASLMEMLRQMGPGLQQLYGPRR